MVNKNGALGTSWETAIVRYFRETFWPEAMRRTKAGKNDPGDIHGPRGWTIEAKNHGRIELASFMGQVRRSAANNGHRFYAVIVKARRGLNSSGQSKDAYFVTTLEVGAYAMRCVEYVEGLKRRPAGL